MPRKCGGPFHGLSQILLRGCQPTQIVMPPGRSCQTPRLQRDEMVVLGPVGSTRTEAMRQTLDKRRHLARNHPAKACPPTADAEFVRLYARRLVWLSFRVEYQREQEGIGCLFAMCGTVARSE